MKSFFKWVFGKALLYIGLVLAVGFGTLALPAILDRVGHDGLARELMSPQALAEQFVKDKDAALAGAETLRRRSPAPPLRR